MLVRLCFSPPGYVAVLGFGSLSRVYYVEAALPLTCPTSGPCSPRASVPEAGGLDLTRAATLMGFCLPRGFPLPIGGSS
jgi:hypothetical protein